MSDGITLTSRWPFGWPNANPQTSNAAPPAQLPRSSESVCTENANHFSQFCERAQVSAIAGAARSRRRCSAIARASRLPAPDQIRTRSVRGWTLRSVRVAVSDSGVNLLFMRDAARSLEPSEAYRESQLRNGWSTNTTAPQQWRRRSAIFRTSRSLRPLCGATRRRAGRRQIDARVDEFFAVFQRAGVAVEAMAPALLCHSQNGPTGGYFSRSSS